MNTSSLRNVVVVLDEPQNLVNVAGAVRAMKNMGLDRLRLVRPAEFDAWRITGIAHRSEDLVARAEHFETLEEAVADARLVVGTSARPRTAQRNYVRPAEAASRLLEDAAGGTVAVLFGREDRGLSNHALDLCHAVCIIPTRENYTSLNLAQAVLVLTYEIFMAALDELPELPKGRRSGPVANQADLEEMYQALENGLARIDFFKARQPESVIRTLRTIFARTEMDLREARLVRAMGFEIGHYLDRLGNRDEDD